MVNAQHDFENVDSFIEASSNYSLDCFSVRAD